MGGLTDSTTGLAFGTGLEFQAPIGGAGLAINVLNPPGTTSIMVAEDGTTVMQTESGDIMITEG